MVDVYFDKIGKSEPLPDSDILWYGNKMEPVIAERFSNDSGLKVRNDFKMRIHPDRDYVRANVDRTIVANEAYGNEGPGILEIKTTSPYRAKNFGDKGVAQSWYIQLQHYLLV